MYTLELFQGLFASNIPNLICIYVWKGMEKNMRKSTIGSVLLSTKQFDHEAISINSEKKWPLLLERWNVWVFPVSPLRFSGQKKRLALPQRRSISLRMCQQMLRCLMLSGVLAQRSPADSQREPTETVEKELGIVLAPKQKRKAGVALVYCVLGPMLLKGTYFYPNQANLPSLDAGIRYQWNAATRQDTANQSTLWRSVAHHVPTVKPHQQAGLEYL